MAAVLLGFDLVRVSAAPTGTEQLAQTPAYLPGWWHSEPNETFKPAEYELERAGIYLWAGPSATAAVRNEHALYYEHASHVLSLRSL